MSSRTRRIVTFVAPGEVEVRSASFSPPGPGEVLVETTMSAISPGTERLVFRGEVPSASLADGGVDVLSEDLDFPVAYGYSAVGRVTEVGTEVDPEWRGRRVFSFQPHATHFVAAPDDLIVLPDGIRDEDAVLLPNVETSVNLVMDGRLLVGERVVIFGQGVVGLLTAAIASQYPLEALLTVEPDPGRRAKSEGMGADRSYDPEKEWTALQRDLGISKGDPDAGERGPRGYRGADLTYELTGKPEVVNDAISITGFDGRVVVGSWYGTRKADIDLGGRFHRSRIELISSQVSTIDPDLRGRWSKERRMETVLDLLLETRPGTLVSEAFSIDEASAAYEAVNGRAGSRSLQPVFEYE